MLQKLELNLPYIVSVCKQPHFNFNPSLKALAIAKQKQMNITFVFASQISNRPYTFSQFHHVDLPYLAKIVDNERIYLSAVIVLDAVY